MQPQQSTVHAEVRSAIKSRSHDARAELLRRLVSRLSLGFSRLSEYQIADLDNAICALLTRVDQQTRRDVAATLSKLDRGPPLAIGHLARDDISVAHQVLARANAIDVRELQEVSRRKGRDHLLAICERTQITSSVTDLIIARGDNDVLKKLVSNDGARLSERGFSTIVAKSSADEGLASAVGVRDDLPLDQLRKLLWETSDSVRDKLVAAASPKVRELIEQTLATIYRELGNTPEEEEEIAALVGEMEQAGAPDDAKVASFALARDLRRLIAAIVVLSKAPSDLVSRVVRGPRADLALVACKAADLTWGTAEVVLKNRHGREVPDAEIQVARKGYGALTIETAQLTLKSMVR